MSRYDRDDVGLLLVNESGLVPTILKRREEFSSGDQDIDAADFDIGHKAVSSGSTKNKDYENYYRHFKDDLSLSISSLKSPSVDTWRMKTYHTDRGRSHERYDEIIKQEGSKKVYFNPKHATYVYLKNLITNAIDKTKDLTSYNEGIKVHFTYPAYEGVDKKRSQKYRDNIRDVIRSIEEEENLEGAEIKEDKNDFLYEPYGVYYYYSFVQKSVSTGKNNSSNTYLIYDMGGSTTDLGVVQVNNQGDTIGAYPICESIRCAGSDFDSYLLEYIADEKDIKISGNERRVAVDRIEDTKIDLCSQKTDKKILEIKGSRFEITKNKISSALKEFWKDNSTEIRGKFKDFIREAQDHANENQLFVNFEEIEKVFLAGGSIGLPGLKDLILSTLKSPEFDLVKDGEEEDLFETPHLAPSSSVASLGRAAELANQKAPGDEEHDALARAQYLCARITDHEGKSLRFRPKALQDISDTDVKEHETFLFKVNDLQNRAGNDNWGRFENSEYQNYNLDSNQSFPKEVNISIRNNLRDYPPDEHFSEGVKKELVSGSKSADYLRFKFSCDAQYDQNEVRVKPFVYVDHEGTESKRRLYRDQGSTRVSLQPGEVEGEVHICIDLGMNNTCVSICTPGRQLPDVEDLDVPVLKDITAPDPILPKDLPDIIRHISVSTKHENIANNILENINNIRECIDTLPKQMSNSEKEELRSDGSHPADKIIEKISNNESLLKTSKSKKVLNKESFDSFSSFIDDHQENLHYPDSVLRPVWAHVQSGNNRLAVLAGPPGSGKSSLVRLVAQFFNRDIGEHYQHYYFLQPVSPTWFSPSGLFGSYSEIDEKYHATDFLNFLMTAQEHYECIESEGSPRPFFACLDEFNISKPEQYMSNILSKMEANRNVKSRLITLCRSSKMKGWERDLKIRLTPNLKFFATINTDSTTNKLSPKVLDRSTFIRLTPDYSDLKKVSKQKSEEFNVKKVHNRITKEKGERQDDKEPGSLLGDLVMASRYAETPFGYRVIERSYEYASNDTRTEDNLKDVLDDIICNFFLPKFPGSHAVSNPMEYVDALEPERVKRLRKYPKAGEILDSIQNGLPGQAAV